jgi:hypothetical protein
VYTWQRLSQVPSTFTADPDGQTTITCTWDDLALDETGYSVVHGYFGDYDYMQTLTIDSDKVDATLTNFPVMVRLVNGVNFDFTHCETGGTDIWFLSSDLSDTLDFEPFWTNAGGDTMITWVKVPSISSTTDTDFYMIFGNSDASDLSNGTAVWDANYKMVQHMTDSTTALTSDATSNGNFGTKKGANEPIESAGKIGMAQTFDGNDYINSSTTMNMGTSDITISAFVKTTNSSVLDIAGKLRIGITTQYGLRLSGGKVACYIANDSTGVQSISTISVNDNNWHYGAITFDRDGSAQIYVDGIPNGIANDISFMDGYDISDSDVSVIGARYAGTYSNYFNGIIDEVRISNTARSAAWMKCEYYTAVDSLLSFGSEVDLVYGTAAADAETVQLTSLSVNTLYRLGIRVDGGVMDRTLSAVLDSCYTYANAPNVPTVSYPSTSLIKIVLDTNSNPSYTHIAIQDSISGLYVQLIPGGVADTLGASASWNTYAEWGGANGCSLSVTPGREYRLRAKARSTNQ